jgi:magnesium transporter
MMVVIIDQGAFWIDILKPTDQELNAIARVFGLHPLTKEDIQSLELREKCEVFPTYFFVSFHSFEKDQLKASFMEPIPIYIVIFDECVLTV